MASYVSTRVPVAVQFEALVCRLVHQVNDVWPLETEAWVAGWFRWLRGVKHGVEDAVCWVVLQALRLLLVAVLVALGQRERPLPQRRRRQTLADYAEQARAAATVPQDTTGPVEAACPLPVTSDAVPEAVCGPDVGEPAVVPESVPAVAPVETMAPVEAAPAPAKPKRTRKPRKVAVMPSAAQETKPREGKAPPPKLAALRVRIEAGDSVRAAARAVGVAESTARSWLSRHPA
jgi:hypothetical protein